MKRLTQKINLETVILGSGNQEDIIKKMIYKYKLDKKVKMISHKNNPYPYIKQSNILVLCSFHEGLPNVLIESAVLKTFVISSNCQTGPKEILLNGRAGALFEVSNSKHLANKILYFKRES